MARQNFDSEEDAYLAGVLRGRGEKKKPKREVPDFIGRMLPYSGPIQMRYAAALRDVVGQLTRETKRDLIAAFKSPDGNIQNVAMDASIADLMNKVIDGLLRKFTVLFDAAATRITANMMTETWGASTRALDRSLKDTAARVTITPNEVTQQLMDAASQESVALIKRVPAEYLPKVQGDVMRSITSGNGLQDLVPQLDERNVKIKNWATNVARDQTRKAYSTVNRVRMESAGVKKFRWIHSGGGNEPREHHLKQWPAGLNNGVFSFDDPPVIDERTGETGFPAQLPYCGCTMQPVIDLDDL